MLIVGPWIHGPANIDNQFSGDFDFGSDAALNINDLRLPWFDHWAKDAEIGVMDEPPVRIFVMGREDWIIPGTQHTNFYLHGGTSGSANSLNDGTLSTVPPHGAENPASYTYDPANLVPSRGGNTQTIPNGAFSQRDVEVRCLTFTSEPLTEEIEATGHVSAVLYAASSALDTDWVVRVTDVHPDGHSRPIADGILRARYRDFFEKRTLLSPGQIYKYDIDLWATSNAFLQGHRIRVTITSSCFPRFDSTLNTGGPIHKEAVGQVAI